MLIDIKQLEFIDQTLRNLCLWLERETGATYTITSIYRDGDAGVHGTMPVRGIDIRCREKVLADAIVDTINTCWKYDPDRPHLMCAKAHGEGYNFHIHLQVHPNTKKIK